MKFKVITKSIILISVWIIYSIVYKMFYPIVTNDIALKQFNDNIESFTDLTMYQNLWHFSWIIPLIICVIIFWSEIKFIYNKIISGGF